MNFFQAIQSAIKNCFNFKSRSPRSEFWYFYLFNALFSFLFALIESSPLKIILFDLSFYFLLNLFKPDFLELFLMLLLILISLFLTVAGITLSIRRLHDIDKSGWWLLIGPTIIGLIPLYYWYCKKGDESDNRFGKNPLKTNDK